MAQQTDVQLTAEADVIGNETVAGANTKTRIATMHKNTIDSKINNDLIDTEVTLDTASKTVPGRDAVKTYISTAIAAIDGSIATASINGAITLDDSDFGKLIELTDSGSPANYTVVPPLPAAGNIGKTIYFKGLTTLTMVVTISRGSVTIAGETDWKLSKAGIVGLMSDGTNYIVIDEVGSWIPFTPTWAGFSANPTGVVAKYFRQGRRCSYHLQTGGLGTSNATSTTVTGPLIAKIGSRAIIRACNSGTWAAGLISSNDSTIINLFPVPAASAWTASGGKGVDFQFEFEF